MTPCALGDCIRFGSSHGSNRVQPYRFNTFGSKKLFLFINQIRLRSSSSKLILFMANRCWKHACYMMSDEVFIQKKKFGIDTNNIPVHISFVYVGSKLHLVCSNVGSYHAEENCLRQLKYLPKNKPIRIIVTKITGIHAMSRPCYHCTRMLNKFLPQARVYYTDYENNLCEDTTRDTEHISKGRINRFQCMVCS
jgi:hypothetical protein